MVPPKRVNCDSAHCLVVFTLHLVELCPRGMHVVVFFTVLLNNTRKNAQVCYKSVHKLLTRCVRTACHKLSTGLEQLVDNL
jgi:hypothetical protein